MNNELLRERIQTEAHSQAYEGALLNFTHSSVTRNPLCGDFLEMRLLVSDHQISAVRTQIRGCLVTSASAHALARAIEGRNVTEARALAAEFVATLSGKSNSPLPGTLADYAVFKKPHARQKCALLGAEALLQALESFVEN